MVAAGILGRDTELASIVDFIERTRATPSAVLLKGEAGIGKTTIWTACVAHADAWGRVLVARAAKAERDLSFTVLGDLLRPILDALGNRLPDPQRRALEVALLLADPADGARDARAVSLATSSAMRNLALDAPLTVAVDDMQWSDEPSARALAFALRRLRDEPVTVLLTRRAGGRTGSADRIEAALPATTLRMNVGPLSMASSVRLLRDRMAAPVPRTVAYRIHEASGGNPFYALEIGERIQRGSIRLVPGEPLEIPNDLVDLVRVRIGGLSPAGEDASLLIASSMHPTIALIERAGATGEGIDEAKQAGFVEAHDDELSFTHPILALTVYGNATPEERRRAHRRLSDVATDPESRSRHLALGSTPPDAAVAQASERAAAQARARGAPASAADLLQLALAFAGEDDPLETLRIRQLIAGNLHDAGDVHGARAMLHRAIEEAPPGPERAEALFRASILEWNDVATVRMFLEQALREGRDPSLVSRAHADMVWAHILAGDVPAAVRSGEIAVAQAPTDRDIDNRLAYACLGLARAAAGLDADADLEKAIALEGRFAAFEGHSGRLYRGLIRMWRGDLNGARDDVTTVDEALVDQGLESQRHLSLAWLAKVEARAGNLRLASTYADEALDICDDAGLEAARTDALTARGIAAAYAGDAERALDDAASIEDGAERHGDGWARTEASWVRGFLALSAGEVTVAHSHFEPAMAWVDRSGIREPGVFPYAPDEVDALVALGRLEEAKAITDRLEFEGREFGRPLAIATSARCRGLISAALGDLPGALVQLDSALDAHTADQQPFERARTLLVHGETQRRMKRKQPARTTISEAVEIFDACGARLWSQRARTELGRIGGRPPSPGSLTQTESEVARLVAGGATNREVAAALFISVHTVESNLKRIYRKLGLRSRTELASRLRAP